MKPQVYRTPTGEVYQNGSRLSLHNGFWWWDAGCAIAPEGQEKYLPVYDEEKDMTYCCDQMHKRATYQCDQHPDRFQCGDCLIHYSEEHKKFGIIVHDGGSSFVTINACPWCGDTLPGCQPNDQADRMIDVGDLEIDESSVSVPERTQPSEG